MDRRKFRIEINAQAAKDTFKLVLKDCSGKELDIRAGQFVDIEIPGFFLRRPIAVCDCTEDSLTLYYKVVGEGTKVLSNMQQGEYLDLLVGLGTGFDARKCKQSALLVGGGLGCGAMYLLAKQLLELGRQVSVVQCFNTASDVVLIDEFRALGLQSTIATLDGSLGVKGFAMDAIATLLPQSQTLSQAGSSSQASESESKPYALPYDFFYTCGPMPMMKSVCEALSISGEASLEERMGCGAGYCYGCSRHSKSGAKRICKDGPVFPKEDIIW